MSGTHYANFCITNWCKIDRRIRNVLPPGIMHRVFDRLSLPLDSLLETGCRWLLTDAHTLCLFIGHDRSGHSLIGHLLNQHPLIAIAHEYGLVDKLRDQRNQRCIYQLLVQIKHETQKSKNSSLLSSGYRYRKLDIEFSTTEPIRVLGDKEGDWITDGIHQYGWDVLRPFESTGKTLKYLFCLRNPYDIISTKVMRDVYRGLPIYSIREHNISIRDIAAILNAEERHQNLCRSMLPAYIEQYFQRLHIVEQLETDHPDWPLLPIYHHDFTDNPSAILQGVLGFLDLPSPPRLFGGRSEASPFVPAESRFGGKFMDTRAHCASG